MPDRQLYERRRSSKAFGRDLREAARCLGEYENCVAKEQALGLDDTPRRKASDLAEDAAAAAVAADARAAAKERGDDDEPQSPQVARAKLRDDADAALNQAWDLYYTVFRRVNKQLPQLTTLELRYVSPALLNARSLELAVPGTYRVDGSAARIARFSPSVHVITSKQRPRRLAMRGEDGREYGFLLKGHEDLRQDERAMQLFGLANALLAKDRRTSEHGHLFIQRYAITPLSQNCGIIGWVPACDTLHALVRDFRDARKVVLNVEHRVMLQLAPDYDALTCDLGALCAPSRHRDATRVRFRGIRTASRDRVLRAGSLRKSKCFMPHWRTRRVMT